uniref:Selenoprotein P N-terminal domain-containing protein n=1 Tax=Caenorhabditis japonica TaxID=281687 RepID=A0A8R1HTA8_CAEJA
MQRFLLPLFFFLLYSFPVSTVLPHQICTASPSVTFRGANDVTRGGDAAVLVFGQLQCANCYGFLRRLNEMAGQRSHRVFVVAPDFESNHIIQRTVSAFPNLQIDRAGEGWPRLGASNFDAMVLDSCGRITDTLSWPKTDVTASHSLQMAMDASRTKCGPCSVPRVTNKKINAYINEQQEQRVRDGGRAAYQPNQRAYQQSGPPQQQQNYPYQNQYQPPYQHQNQHTYPQNYGANGASNNFYTPPPPPPPPAKTTTTAPRIVTTS